MKKLPLWRRPCFARHVLDIGAGHNPFKGVTHLLDIDVEQGRERGWSKLVIPHSASLIVGNVEDLPLEAGAFDYVYASHVLEHVDSPERACTELMRVSRAGYVETPSPFLEQGLGLINHEPAEASFHKWLVFTLGSGQLVFEPKTPNSVFEFCSCQDGHFMREFYQSVEFAEAQHYFRRKAKTTILYWKTSFCVEVRDRTVDCNREGLACRFRGMRRAVLENCNDMLRAKRVLTLGRRFPECRSVLRKFGHRTLWV